MKVPLDKRTLGFRLEVLWGQALLRQLSIYLLHSEEYEPLPCGTRLRPLLLDFLQRSLHGRILSLQNILLGQKVNDLLLGMLSK